MKPWRDIYSIEQWKRIIDGYNSGQIKSIKLGMFSKKDYYTSYIVPLTDAINTYHGIDKSDPDLVGTRIGMLKGPIKGFAEYYLLGKLKGDLDKNKIQTGRHVRLNSMSGRCTSRRSKAAYLERLRIAFGPGGKLRKVEEKHGDKQGLIGYLQGRGSEVDENHLHLHGGVVLEKWDPEHRPVEFQPVGDNMIASPANLMAQAFLQWMESDSARPFFFWLEDHPICTADKGEIIDKLALQGIEMGFDIEGLGKVRVGDVESVRYDLDTMKREDTIRLLYPRHSKLQFMVKQTREVEGLAFMDVGMGNDPFNGWEDFDSGNVRKGDLEHERGYAFVWDKSESIFAGMHMAGKLHHSSLSGGKQVRCAGMIQAHRGKVTVVSGNSGHYQPAVPHIRNFVGFLAERNCLQNDQIPVYFYNPKVNKIVSKPWAEFRAPFE